MNKGGYMDCIFCKIIKNEMPSYKIYEDDVVLVMMDIDPTTDGHLLIIPKKHYVNLSDIDLNTLNHIYKVAKDMYILLKEKLNIDGLTLTQNNDYGQEVKHYHLHLVPRYKNDGIHFSKRIETSSIEEIYNKING